METKAEYVGTNGPLGILEITVEGSPKPQKTVFVEYGYVRPYMLSAIAHINTNIWNNPAGKAAEEVVQGWLDFATNTIFLQDSLPFGGSIESRYENVEDVNCPIALFLDDTAPIETFNGIDVVAKYNDPSLYNRIQTTKQFGELTSTPWVEGTANAHGFDLIIVKDLHYFAGYATRNGSGSLDGHIWVSVDAFSPDRHISHEFGHYKGGLLDRYICEICEEPPQTCVHNSEDPFWSEWKDPAYNKDNLMTIGINDGVCPGDVTVLR